MDVLVEYNPNKTLVANVKERTMVNKNLWLGILVMVLVFGMTVVGCDNGGGKGGKTVTFSLNKVNSTTFTITVDGAKWTRTSDTFSHAPVIVNITGTGRRNSDNAVVNVGLSTFVLVKTSDTLITATLSTTNPSGGLTLVNATVSLPVDDDLYGVNVTDGGRNAEYKFSRSSITLP